MFTEKHMSGEAGWMDGSTQHQTLTREITAFLLVPSNNQCWILLTIIDQVVSSLNLNDSISLMHSEPICPYHP